MALSRNEIYNLRLFTIFVILAEMFHIYINTAPPLYLRLIYICIYLFFCFTNIKLIPFFTGVNLVIERSSIVYGEFLPNNLWFHVIILFICFVMRHRNSNVVIGRSCNALDYMGLIFLLVIAIFGYVIHIMTISDTGFIASIIFSLLLLFCLSFYSVDETRLFVYYVILSTAVSIFFSFINYGELVSNFYTSDGYVDRLSWKDANYISFFIGSVFLVALFLLKNNSRNKNVYRISLVISLIAICLLISRGTILFLIISLIYYYRNLIFRISSIKYYLLLILVLFTSYYIGFFDNIIERFLSDDFSTGSGRIDIWKQGIDNFFNKDLLTILFGAGANQSVYMASSGNINWSPHNNYLEMLFNYGIFGLIFFVLFFIFMFFSGKSNEKKTLVIYISLSCITIVPFTFVMPIWIMLPILIVLDKKVLCYE